MQSNEWEAAQGIAPTANEAKFACEDAALEIGRGIVAKLTGGR